MTKDEKYAEARMNLDGAMADFIAAAQAIGMSNGDITNDVCDSLYDGSGGAIKAEATIDQ